MIHRLMTIGAMLTVILFAGALRGQEAVPPREVKVLPVFFVPKGELPPTSAQTKLLLRHLDWSRTRYRELLRNQTTFAVAPEKPFVYRSKRPLTFYRKQPEGSAPQIVSELLAKLKWTRYNCPYVLLVVVMNPKDDFPVPGGRSLNGGFDTGGGVIVLSSFSLDQIPNFQSTLQHELGHAFGLPHVEVYGYDMKSNDSLMAYNLKHHTNGFRPSGTPGKLIPEDFRGLALNQRVFPKLRFDPAKDIPQGYTISERLVILGPMKIPDQPDGVKITTESGQEFGSKVANIVQGRILPSKKPGEVKFDQNTMWHSGKTATKWVSVEITFPYAVELTRVAVHSQHSGEYHAAQGVRVAVRESEDKFRVVIEKNLKSVDDTVTLPKTKGRVWQFEFRAGESEVVVIRGLRFFSGDDELFPPVIPYKP